MAIEKFNRDIAAARAEIAELQRKIRALEAQKVEEENLEIVKLVKMVNLDRKQLAVFLKAYAKGDIVLPESYLAELEQQTAKQKENKEAEKKPQTAATTKPDTKPNQTTAEGKKDEKKN